MTLSNTSGTPAVRLIINGLGLKSSEIMGLAEVRVQQLLGHPTMCELHFRYPPGPLDRVRRLKLGDTLKVELEDERTPLFNGDITAIEHGYANNAEELYVRAYDLLHRLRKRQAIRMWDDVDMRTIVGRLTNNLSVDVDLPFVNIEWERLYQFGQTDFQLLTEVTARAGLYMTLHNNDLRFITLAGYGSQIKLERGKDLSDVTVELNSDAAADEVVAFGWNRSLVSIRRGVAGKARSSHDIKADVSVKAVDGDRQRVLVNEPTLDHNHAVGIAQADLDQRNATVAVLTASTGGNPDLVPGRKVDIIGFSDAISGEFVITEATHTITGADGYVTEINSNPPELPERPREDITTYGVISEIRDPQRRGRVRATLPAYNDIETDWMSVMMPGAGPGKGFITLPDKGDSVLISLAGGDPAQGLVLGGLFGSAKMPDTGLGVGGVKQQTWRSAGGQTIQLNDTGDKIRMETDAGAYIELSNDNITIVGNRIDLRRINVATQAAQEAADAGQAINSQQSELRQSMQEQAEKDVLVRNIALAIALLAILAFIGYIVWNSVSGAIGTL